MTKELENWLKSKHRNKHWFIDSGGRWQDGDGACVRDRGPATEQEIREYRELTKQPLPN